MAGSTIATERRPFRVSLPGFVVLTAAIFLLVGLGAQAATAITGRSTCLQAFFEGSGALLLVMLATFEFSLARLVVRHFSDGEPLRPAWFLIMLAGGCHLVGALCAHVLGTDTPLNPLAYGRGALSETTLTAIYRFGLIAGGPLKTLLFAAGLFFLLCQCRALRLPARVSWLDGSLLVVFIAGVCGEASQRIPATTYDLLLAAEGPLLIVLTIEAIVLRRCMGAMGSGVIAKCWKALATAIFLSAFGHAATWLSASSVLSAEIAASTWYIGILSATAYALAPAWQVEAIQRACGEVGLARFSPFTSSLAALRLINRVDG